MAKSESGAGGAVRVTDKLQSKTTENNGGRNRARTCDPLIKSQLLYQLSYAPVASATKGRKIRRLLPGARDLRTGSFGHLKGPAFKAWIAGDAAAPWVNANTIRDESIASVHPIALDDALARPSTPRSAGRVPIIALPAVQG